MQFSSITFLFLFLPVFFLAYFLAPRRWLRNLVLLAGSLFFYFWADARHVWLLFFLAGINYCFGLFAKLKPQKDFWRRLVFSLTVVLNLAPLGYFKYAAFFMETLNSVFSLTLPVPELSLPTGLSFITFCCLSYVLDVNNGTLAPEVDLVTFSNFVTFFPKLTQGPIARFAEFKKGIFEKSFDVERIAGGIRRFITGLGKKVLLADSLAAVTGQVFRLNPADYGAAIAWYGLIGYGLQIYFDFSGYTDMAIGLGQILGFSLPENFNHPYSSRSITDFWRRWHMTLTAWFRNYVFLPLESRRRHVRFLRQPTHIMLVFALTGFWHSAGWNFILWGLYYGFILSAETLGLGRLLKKTPAFFQHAYTLVVVLFGWILFRLTDPGEWIVFMKTLVGMHNLTAVYTARSLNLLAYWPVYLVAVLLCLPLETLIKPQYKSSRTWQIFETVGHLAVFFFAVSLVLSRGFQSFLYAQF